MTQLEIVRTVDMVAAEIRALTASMLSNVIEIGRRMCEAKEILPYGEFGKWIEDNTGYSVSTANNFMRLFREYGAAQGSLFGAEVECQTIGKLSYSKALALLTLPAAERESFAQENHVENMSIRELKKAIRERDKAQQRAAQAEQDREGSALAMAQLQDKLEEAERRATDARRALDELAEENEQLRTRPADVAVQYQTDPAEIEAAAKKARDEEQARYQSRLQQAEKKVKLSREQQEKAEFTLKAAEAEVEALRNRLAEQNAIADPVTAEFKGLFEQASAIVLKLRKLAEAAPEGRRDKLKKALAALARQMEGV